MYGTSDESVHTLHSLLKINCIKLQLGPAVCLKYQLCASAIYSTFASIPSWVSNVIINRCTIFSILSAGSDESVGTFNGVLSSIVSAVIH